MRKLMVVSMLLAFAALPLLADGAATFKAKCALCHGPDGSGDTVMGKKLGIRNLRTADVQKQTDAELIKITTDGKGKMPAYKGKVTDADIKAVVAHIRTLKQ